MFWRHIGDCKGASNVGLEMELPQIAAGLADNPFSNKVSHFAVLKETKTAVNLFSHGDLCNTKRIYTVYNTIYVYCNCI